MASAEENENQTYKQETAADVQLRIQHEIAHMSLQRIGNYDVVRKIGEGSFGMVYLAVHVITRHKVVLKSTDRRQPNLASEIANLRRISHPHITRLYEYVVMPDKVWLVLQYCDGEELFDHLVKHRYIPPAAARSIFAQLTGALVCIHAQHCAHRDLKLENVMLDSAGNVLLGDFGFTRNYAPHSMLDTVCGTEPYMAPELLLRKKYHPEFADVWSLGVIFYATLFGRLPFDEDSPYETTAKVVEAEPSWVPPVPDPEGELEPFISLIKRMLMKDPKSRPKLAAVLTDPALGDLGTAQQSLLTKKQPDAFSTPREKRLLKALKVLNIDVRMLALSVVYHKCDPLHGIWFTALDGQAAQEQRQFLLRRGSRAASVGGRSFSSLRSHRSQRSLRSTSSFKSAKSARKLLRSPQLRSTVDSPRLEDEPNGDDVGDATGEFDDEGVSPTQTAAPLLGRTGPVVERKRLTNGTANGAASINGAGQLGTLPVRTRSPPRSDGASDERKEKPLEKLWAVLTRRNKKAHSKGVIPGDIRSLTSNTSTESPLSRAKSSESTGAKVDQTTTGDDEASFAPYDEEGALAHQESVSLRRESIDTSMSLVSSDSPAGLRDRGEPRRLSRPMSTYSQLSQLSQLSETSGQSDPMSRIAVPSPATTRAATRAGFTSRFYAQRSNPKAEEPAPSSRNSLSLLKQRFTGLSGPIVEEDL